MMNSSQPVTPPEPAESASPAAASAYLRRDRVGIGDTGVFAGDWSNYERDGATRVPVGFVGTLVDWWNGWAVFTCTRQVAEAIVSQQEGLRDAERSRLHGTGLSGQDLIDSLDEMIPLMYWDGDEIVLDESAQYGPDEGISRIGPDNHGRYNVNGWRWTWQVVNPADCDNIAGTVLGIG
jgi:hypothetical protein